MNLEPDFALLVHSKYTKQAFAMFKWCFFRLAHVWQIAWEMNFEAVFALLAKAKPQKTNIFPLILGISVNPCKVVCVWGCLEFHKFFAKELP